MGTKHSSEFRREAVRVALTSGFTRKQVATGFGIGLPQPTSPSLLQRGTPPV